MRCRLVDTVAEGDKEDWREDDEKPGSLLKGVECGEGSVEVDEVVFGERRNAWTGRLELAAVQFFWRRQLAFFK